jgi:hypothetical protein
VRRTCQEVWDEIRTSGADLQVRVVSLTVEDEIAAKSVAVAQTGVWAAGRRTEMVWALAAAVASAIWLALAFVLFEPSADLILGAVPAIATGIAAGTHAVRDARSGTLHWR